MQITDAKEKAEMLTKIFFFDLFHSLSVYIYRHIFNNWQNILCNNS